MNIIDGKKISRLIHLEIKEKVKELLSKGLDRPGFSVIKVGDDKASTIYLKHKKNSCQEVGFFYEEYCFSNSCSQRNIIKLIHSLNKNPKIHGILVQLPLPSHFSHQDIVESISPYKDVDGFHPYNMGRLIQKNPFLSPCTSRGVMYLINSIFPSIRGKNTVVVGSSNIVGRPMLMELLSSGATVTICHSSTKNLIELLLMADIVVVAIGKAQFIRGSWLKKKSTVIDVGINRSIHGRVEGDVNFLEAIEKVEYITPVPGGVGPMTIAMLLKNIFLAYRTQNNF